MPAEDVERSFGKPDLPRGHGLLANLLNQNNPDQLWDIWADLSEYLGQTLHLQRDRMLAVVMESTDPPAQTEGTATGARIWEGHDDPRRRT